MARTEGRLAEARRLQRESATLRRTFTGNDALLDADIVEATEQGSILADRVGMKRILDRALQRIPLASLPLSSRPLATLVYLYSYAGDPARARAYLGEWDRSRQQFQRLDDASNRRGMLGAIASAERRFPDAIRDFRESDREGLCDWCSLIPLADAYEATGNPDSAIVVLTRFVNMTRVTKIWSNSFDLAPIHERLGLLYEAKGDRARAAAHYTTFVQLWRNADPELQPRVRAARQRVAQLRAAGAG
jgi:tetratricopeptide (TPR) repeat protein